MRLAFAVVFLWSSLHVLSCLGIVRTTAHASPLDEREVIAKTLIAEAGEARCSDHAAILHVLKRRTGLPRFRGRSIADVAQAYSSFWNDAPKKPRQLQIHGLTWDEMPAWTHQLIEAFEGGLVPDPCEGKAIHWGSLEDSTKRTDLRAVDCGQTANVFFDERFAEPIVPIFVPMTPVVLEPPEPLSEVMLADVRPAPIDLTPWTLVLGLLLVIAYLAHRNHGLAEENEDQKIMGALGRPRRDAEPAFALKTGGSYTDLVTARAGPLDQADQAKERPT